MAEPLEWSSPSHTSVEHRTTPPPTSTLQLPASHSRGLHAALPPHPQLTPGLPSGAVGGTLWKNTGQINVGHEAQTRDCCCPRGMLPSAGALRAALALPRGCRGKSGILCHCRGTMGALAADGCRRFERTGGSPSHLQQCVRRSPRKLAALAKQNKLATLFAVHVPGRFALGQFALAYELGCDEDANGRGFAPRFIFAAGGLLLVPSPSREVSCPVCATCRPARRSLGHAQVAFFE